MFLETPSLDLIKEFHGEETCIISLNSPLLVPTVCYGRESSYWIKVRRSLLDKGGLFLSALYEASSDFFDVDHSFYFKFLINLL